jgi:hypothetical protein
MGYATVVLILVGFAIGLLFRLKILFLVIGVVFLSSLLFSLGSGFSFLNTALTVVVTQAIFQSSYFLGLWARATFAADRLRQIL